MLVGGVGRWQGLLGIFWSAFAVHLYSQFSKPYTPDVGNHTDSTPLSR